jgi:hypothetical protein
MPASNAHEKVIVRGPVPPQHHRELCLVHYPLYEPVAEARLTVIH